MFISIVTIVIVQVVFLSSIHKSKSPQRFLQVIFITNFGHGPVTGHILIQGHCLIEHGLI